MSPGCRASTAFCRSAELDTAVPPASVMTSPTSRPAAAAGVPGLTSLIGDSAVGRLHAYTQVRVGDLTGADQLRDDRLDRVRGDREADAVVAARVACDLRVHTDDLADRSSSGPPELPWLIAASVWIESLIVKPFGASIWRCSALTIPLVTVCSNPSGLPIATTDVSDVQRVRVSERERGQKTDAGASTFSTARSVEGSLPTSSAW